MPCQEAASLNRSVLSAMPNGRHATGRASTIRCPRPRSGTAGPPIDAAERNAGAMPSMNCSPLQTRIRCVARPASRQPSRHADRRVAAGYRRPRPRCPAEIDPPVAMDAIDSTGDANKTLDIESPIQGAGAAMSPTSQAHARGQTKNRGLRCHRARTDGLRLGDRHRDESCHWQERHR